MGWLSDKLFGKKAKLDLNKIAQFQSGTQGLVTEQLGLSRQMMDPNSAINAQMRHMMAQQAGTAVIISNPVSSIASFVAPSDPSNLLFNVLLN